MIARPSMRLWLPWIACLFALLAVWALGRVAHARLESPVVLTGWCVLLLVAALAGFNARKRLAMLPLGSAAAWLRWHVALGFLAMAVFWLHTGSLWPMGRHEQALTVAFYLTQASGVVGWVLQAYFPRQLADTGVELVYERIPHEVARLRAEAEAILLDSVRETGGETLSQLYSQTLHWYFRRPRFLADHLFSGGKGARAWLRQSLASTRQHLNAAEQSHLDRIADLAGRKAEVDFHHAGQSVMKWWLFLHIPAAMVLVILSLWHVALVFLFAK